MGSSTDTSYDRLVNRLHNFTTRHTSHHRPIALVTSGGTAADLEVNAVRFLDNFSTGLRGACAVEQFLKRGYAVVHLKRTGSVSPFGRLVEDAVSVDGGRMGFESIGELFDCNDRGEFAADLDGDFNPKLNGAVSNKQNGASKSSNDPWLYSTERYGENDHQYDGMHLSSHSKSRRTYGELSLNPRLTNSHILHSTIRSYNSIIQQGLLVTITFRTVDEYLQKLQQCCETIKTCGSLGLVYLAAAVSDFYIPLEKRAVHKIQSRDYGLESSKTSDNSQIDANNTLTLTLYPVPKVIPTLRSEWCPDAFIVSFKLETDSNILRQKATMAMERNGVNLVIGNELKTRYEKVFILSRSKSSHMINGPLDDTYQSTSIHNEIVGEYCLTEVTSANINTMQLGSSKSDALEDATIEYVVRHHFYYISTQLDNTRPNMSSVELFTHTACAAEEQHQSRLKASYHRLQREKLKSRVVELAWNIAGSALGIAISYGVGRMLQQRQQR